MDPGQGPGGAQAMAKAPAMAWDDDGGDDDAEKDFSQPPGPSPIAPKDDVSR